MEFITYEQEGFVGILTINRPKALNALNSQVLDELNETIDSIDINETRALILTGAGDKSFVAGATALAGIGFISLKESFTIGIGDSLSVLFAVIFGVQIVLIGKLVDKDSDIAGLTFFQMLTAALAGFAVCIAQGGLTLDIGKEAIIGVVYLGVLNTFVAFMAQNYAQKYAKDTTAALIMSMESLFGFLFSVLYYKEVITVKFLAGSVLCFAAVLMNTIEKGRKSG